MKRKRGWLIGPLVILALLLCAVPAYAIPPIPHSFYGTVTIGGFPAPEGTVVTAEVGEVEYGSITTTVEGQYGSSDPLGDRLLVAPGEGDIETGDTIYFYADGSVANQTYAFSPGTSTELDLTVTAPDETSPTVEITSTASDPTNTSPIPMTATFSETVTGFVVGDITVGNGTAGTFVAVSGTVYTFDVTPAADGAVTVDIAAGVAQDAATNPNEAATQFSITYDGTAPTATVSPAADATGVLVGAAVTATFGEDVLEGALGDITITTDTTEVTGVSATLSEATDTITIAHDDFALDTSYTVTIPAGAVDDLAGNPSAEISWSFTTIIISIPPTVSSVSPVDGAIDVVTYTTVTATFDMAMDEDTITTSSFTLSNGGAVSGTVSYDSGTYTATFTPTAKLESNTTYTATLSTAITSAGGIPLASVYSWSFTTVYAGDVNQDGSVNALDITKVERVIAGLDAQTPGADANQDGNINALDITKVERIIAGLD